MANKKAKCYGKCSDCLYYFIHHCNALSGDDFYVKITARQAKLIAANKNRFNIGDEYINQLKSIHPEQLAG